jgi:uncharacterized membrane protein
MKLIPYLKENKLIDSEEGQVVSILSDNVGNVWTNSRTFKFQPKFEGYVRNNQFSVIKRRKKFFDIDSSVVISGKIESAGSESVLQYSLRPAIGHSIFLLFTILFPIYAIITGIGRGEEGFYYLPAISLFIAHFIGHLFYWLQVDSRREGFLELFTVKKCITRADV